jgi:hypothetical protein
VEKGEYGESETDGNQKRRESDIVRVGGQGKNVQVREGGTENVHVIIYTEERALS